MTGAEPRIVVVGGGFGGLEAAFYLRMRLGDRARISLISAKDHFLFRPNTIYVPFGLDPESLKIRLDRPTVRKAISFMHAPVHDVDPVNKTVAAGDSIFPYDFLVLATGAGVQPTEIPGLREHAQTVWTAEDMLRLRGAFAALRDDARGGRHRNVVFLVPPANKWAWPLYELVFMLHSWLRRDAPSSAVRIIWTTFEAGYLEALGPRLHQLIAGEFGRRGITGLTQHVVDHIEPNEVVYRNGWRQPFDLLVSFPPHVSAMPFPGLPMDNRRFVQTVAATRQIVGFPETYAVGDVGDFPIKQGALACLQADAAAEHLSAQILGGIPDFAFDPVSMGVMEQFDGATFVQVPLQTTGLPQRPIEIRAKEHNRHRFGSGPAWRWGKKFLGVYVPWRFGTGEPFYTGVLWKGLETGFKVISRRAE
jgi:NADH dehydrogenase FAD-containing subunit